MKRVLIFFCLAMTAVAIHAEPPDQELISKTSDGPADGPSSRPRMARDGDFVVFESEAANFVRVDSDAVRDLYRLDLALGSLTLVSVDGAGVNFWYCLNP